MSSLQESKKLADGSPPDRGVGATKERRGIRTRINLIWSEKCAECSLQDIADIALGCS